APQLAQPAFSIPRPFGLTTRTRVRELEVARRLVERGLGFTRTLRCLLRLAVGRALAIAPTPAFLAQLGLESRDLCPRVREITLGAPTSLLGRRNLRRLRSQIVVQGARVALLAVFGAGDTETELEAVGPQTVQRRREEGEIVSRRSVAGGCDGRR